MDLRSTRSTRSTSSTSRTRRSDEGRWRLNSLADGPDEAEQLPANRGRDRERRFAAFAQASVPRTQPALRLGGDGDDGRGLILLARAEHGARQVRPMAIRPRRLDEHPVEMSVAGFGDRAAMHAAPARMFARDQAGVAHELARGREAPQRTDLADEGGGRDRPDPAQRGEGPDQSGRCCPWRSRNLLRRCRARS